MSARYSSPLRSPIDSPTSSIRPSLDIPATNRRRASPSPNSTTRRKRTALRDYYNLPAQGTPASSTTTANGAPLSRTGSISSTTSTVITSHPPTINEPSNAEVLPLIDSPNFSAPSYIQSLLSTSSLSNILRAESTLVSEIKNLDGERKALVYDNYSKLIKATETIGGLQRGMGGGREGVKSMESLGPVVERVAKMAGDIAGNGTKGGKKEAGQKKKKNREEVESVRWVVNAPQRWKSWIDQGKEEKVKQEWEEVEGMLDAWKHVKGTDQVRSACEDIVRQMDSSEAESDEAEVQNGGG